MLYRMFNRRNLAKAALSAVLFLQVPVMGVADGTITLRLDNNQQTQADQLVQPDQPITFDKPNTVINVPAVQSSLASKPDVTGLSAVLMDVETGQVLYQRNANVRRPNASTTKMMTAILLIENCGMDDIITASKKASETPYTSLHLKPGEKITVRDLLYGMMIRSANDAAVAAAEHISGTTGKFASLMNKKAAEIGCKDTHFVTPNGLNADGHYSSAYDLCLIARYAMKYPIFNDVTKTRKYMLSSRTKNKEDLAVFSKAKFMRDYPGADGVKSGYIRQAGHCYVGSATRDGWRIVSAVLKSGNSGVDTAAMMDYGFANFMPVSIARKNGVCGSAKIEGGEMASVPLAPVEDLKVIVPKTGATIITKLVTKTIEAPIAKGAKLGTITAYVNGAEAASVDLRAADEVEISFARKFWGTTKMCSLVLACLVVGGKYGATFTKNTRRRRRRVTSPLRSFDRYR